MAKGTGMSAQTSRSTKGESSAGVPEGPGVAQQSPPKQDSERRNGPGSARREGRSRAERDPVNAIRKGRSREQETREDWRGESDDRASVNADTRSRGAQQSLPYTQTNTSRQSDDPWTVPNSVRDRFTQDGHRFYFPDGKAAFRDHGKRLTTSSENTVVVASLIEIANARGWSTITVGGTDRFKQEAWKQGRLAGLDVRGYRPTEPERAALIRAMARRAEDTRGREPSSVGGPVDAERQTPSSSTSDDARDAVAQKSKAGVFAGKLLDHGAAPYKFNNTADQSYYVRLETHEGKRTIWGKDFERAIEESLSRPQIGDQVILQHHGSQDVTVKRRERDQAGVVLNESWVDAYRNRWTLETREFVESRAAAAAALRDPQSDPRHTVQSHPELAGTLLQLHAADLWAREMGDPNDRKKFVAMVRNAFADSVARGEPLRAVHLQDRAAHRTVPEHEQAPSR